MELGPSERKSRSGILALNDAVNFMSTNDSSEQRPTFVRYGVLVLLAAAASSAYLTRHCIAVANTKIQEELHFDDEQMGLIFGAFSLGYFLCQVPGGWLGNKIGTRGSPKVSVPFCAFGGIGILIQPSPSVLPHRRVAPSISRA